MKKANQTHGRGATINPDNRYIDNQRVSFDDGWSETESHLPKKVATQLMIDSAKSIISYNQSPDVPFDRSINPYRGCEHGCVYCFARPSHAYLDLSPGIDFETKLFHKPNAAELLKAELANKNYRCAPIAVGVNTDAYQPVEKELQLTRSILEVLMEHRHPFYIITKSSLIERDIDLLAEAAKDNLVQVAISLTTLDRKLSRSMEPRATAPQRRMQTIKRLSEAGIPIEAFIAPLIPVLNDSELEALLTTAREHGAKEALYILLRLPREVDDIFYQWLIAHEPLKAEHIMQRVRDMRDGKNYQAQFGQRMRGTGVFADLMEQRFKLAVKKLNFPGIAELRSDLFIAPHPYGQMGLF